MATDEPKPESAATSTKRDDGPPTTIDEAAPDTRIDPEFAHDAIAGLKAISRTIKMGDGDPIPDPAPPSAARASAPSSEAITLKRKGKSAVASTAPDTPEVDSSKPVLAGAAAEPATEACAPKIDATQADPAPAPPPVEVKPKRAIRETLTDDGGLSQTQPDPVPLEPTVDERVVAEREPKARVARRQKASPLSNPLVWLVGAIMVAALVAFGIFLSTQGSDPPQKREKSAKPSSTPNVPLPQTPTTTSAPQQPAPTDTPAPVTDPNQPTPTPTPTPRPNGSGATPKPIPTPTTSGGTPFTLPSTIPTVFFPGIGTPPGQSGSTGP